jgi:hypothetical protein
MKDEYKKTFNFQQKKNGIMKFKNILYFIFAACLTVACSDDNTSDLLLNGDCMVTDLSIDEYESTIDATKHEITVRVPETYDLSSTTVTTLTLSDGAKSNIRQGDKLNLLAPKVMNVTNGNVFIDWTIKAVCDEAKITAFIINDTYNGIIDQDAKTITVYIPESEDITSLTPTIRMSENAEVAPMGGTQVDFTNPVDFVVTNNTATATYKVTVTKIGKPSAVFVGAAASMTQLNIAEQTACQWMLSNIPNSIYVSFADIQNGTVDLSECKVIWWHFHKDWGVDGKDAFEGAAPEALAAIAKLKDYYHNGGSFLLTRYASYLPAYLGAVANEGLPNNCWGGAEESPEITGGEWTFFMKEQAGHQLYKGLKTDDGKPNEVVVCEAGYGITNSTAQWHIGSDWGGYDNLDAWKTKTGATPLGFGGDGAVVAWEFPAAGSNGGILCIGSGCYDWYSAVPCPNDKYHGNIATMTHNAFNYLMNK